MSGRCTSQPISWLVLERYCLGELDDSSRRDVEVHLGKCDVCSACRDDIEGHDDIALPALPPLPVPKPTASWLGLRGWRAAWAGLATAAVAAAALIVFVVIDRSPTGDGVPARVAHVKGGDIALDLVRESGGSVANDPSVFAAADRFKVLVTCPPGSSLDVDIVVYQDEEAAFPLAPFRVDCANRVPVPGAFRITGDSTAVVCVVFGDGARPRPKVGDTLLADLDDAVCLSLEPAGSPR